MGKISGDATGVKDRMTDATGSKGEKRPPADVIGNAVREMRTATEKYPKSARTLRRRAGVARAASKDAKSGR